MFTHGDFLKVAYDKMEPKKNGKHRATQALYLDLLPFITPHIESIPKDSPAHNPANIATHAWNDYKKTIK
jgi:hypothetical protein